MSKKLGLWIILAFIMIIFTISVSANGDNHRASVEKLLALTKQDQILEQMFPQMKQLVLRQLQQLNVPQEQTPILERFYDKMFDVMRDEMSWDNMKEDFIQLYTTVYTEQEIADLIAFYESPTGRKMIEKMPLLVQQSLTISQKYSQRMMPRIQALTRELIVELMSQSKEESNP